MGHFVISHVEPLFRHTPFVQDPYLRAVNFKSLPLPGRGIKLLPRNVSAKAAGQGGGASAFRVSGHRVFRGFRVFRGLRV